MSPGASRVIPVLSNTLHSHISVEEEYAHGYEKRYGKDGFMMLVPAPQNLKTGAPNQSAIATINIEKYD